LEIIGEIWNLVILQPITNVLIALSHYLGNSFGLSIIVLTLFINAAMYPLTRKQMKATKAMQDIQPKLSALQKKHAKDAPLLAQEQMKLYRESGVSGRLSAAHSSTNAYLDCALPGHSRCDGGHS
jgi:YidC/Oxa1 family membrane protein insertase